MSQIIPRRIIQTDKSRNLPLLSRATVASMQLHNPDFEYLFFDDRQVEVFVHKHFPEYCSIFDSFPFKIQRYDFFRYLAIYHYGGFYFDVDVLLARGISELTQCGCVFPCERVVRNYVLRHRYKMKYEIGNYAFGATKQHPFVGAVIDNCVRAQREPAWWQEMLRGMPRILRDDLAVLHTTGPGIVTRTFAEYQRRDRPLEILFAGDVGDPESWNKFGDYGLHLMTSSWRPNNGRIRRRILNVVTEHLDRKAIRLAKSVF